MKEKIVVVREDDVMDSVTTGVKFIEREGNIELA